MSNNTYRNLPTKRLGDVFYTPTNSLTGTTQSWPRSTTAVDNTSVEEILADAVWRIDALDHQNSGAPSKVVYNLGTAGSILDCTSGSTSVPDSRDPQFLDWNGTNYVYLPAGNNANKLSVPDAAALDITGDIDIRCKLTLDDWSQNANPTFIGKWETSGQLSYEFSFRTGGNMRLYWSADGTNTLNSQTTSLIPDRQPGVIKWVRATLDVDNGAGGNDTKFYTSTDGTNWTQLGNTVTKAGTTSIYSGTSAVEIGMSSFNSTRMAGKLYQAQIFDGIDGNKVLDVDTSVITSGSATSFTAETGQTVTIGRHTAGRKTVVVTTPVWLFGTDDQLLVRYSSSGSQAVDFGPNDSFTAVVVMRQWNTNTTFRGILGKFTGPGSAIGPGYMIWTSSPSSAIGFFYEDVTDTGYGRSTAFTNGNAIVCGGLVNRENNSISSISATGTIGSTLTGINDKGNIVNQGILTVGARGSVSANVDMEFVAAMIWRRALSENEITNIRTYYLNRWK
jgi:hypothetical protein